MAVIAIKPSDGVIRQREAAWNSVKDGCDKINEPGSGTNMKFFLPTVDCGFTINSVCDEYPRKVAQSPALYDKQPAKISFYRQACFVYFPGDTIIETFTILVPLRVSGQIELGNENDYITMDEDHYYHILSKAVLRLRAGSRLEAIAIGRIK
ncbi:hypothetical protein BDQ94DRAFT_127265 [Aspergillus welwitschiae]|uniref:Uncharacterized protein n=1 Tax=Aspergillus welwitschiae TaxID=1341132 RepID=A0A3F3PIR2_9EURO|nr:hypothetical protein BDQ94DRAFT_127265 [Aspergillus welwitschiae]RDH26840.1 hypothetical protein BDQ94DRAFT_127265 [Aspergillus welwitschiae]